MALKDYIDKRILIIAEAGVNHNGSIDLAFKLVDIAKEAGADAVKFQTFVTEKSISKYSELAEYQKTSIRNHISQFEMAKGLELTFEEFDRLKKYCDWRNILFLSTPDEEESVDFLCSLGVPVMKIGSGDASNIPLLKYIAKKRTPFILSTGMCNLDDVQDALDALFSEGNKDGALLHCTTEYPAPKNEVNLRAIITLQEQFGLPVGYSDHTEGYEISIAAAALGARIIEKHFTIDKRMKGPDHRASLSASELKNMIEAIRHVEMALGDGKKETTICEKNNIVIARKSVVAARDITAGRKITEQDVCIKKPGFGIKPKDIDKIPGRRARKHIMRDEVITWDKIE